MQSEYYVRRHHDSVRMDKDFVSLDMAIFYANRCVVGSNNTASYEIVRIKDHKVVTIVNNDHSVGFSND